MEKPREQDSASVQRIEAASKRQGEGERTLTLSTGVVLRLKMVPPILMADLATAANKVRPTPPVVHIEALDRSDENPDDPEYQKALQEWFAMSITDINNAFILKGTEVAKVPKGVPAKDNEDFLADMRILGRPVGNERERYLAWVKYVAAPSTDDVTAIIREVGRLSGVAETDVSEAISGFRR